MEETQLVYFKPSTEFVESARKTFLEEQKKIMEAVPSGDIHHIGSTAIPEALTKGDLDLQVRVSKEHFIEALTKLKEIYEINQPNNWTDNYASFKYDSAEMPIGVQLTVMDSEDDRVFQKQQELLTNNLTVLEEYNNLKLSYNGKSIDNYRAARGKFFEGLKTRWLL